MAITAICNKCKQGITTDDDCVDVYSYTHNNDRKFDESRTTTSTVMFFHKHCFNVSFSTDIDKIEVG